MTVTLRSLLKATLRLSPSEQLALIQALSRTLQRTYPRVTPIETPTEPVDAVIPQTVLRTAPVTDLAALGADFWPDEESLGEFDAFLATQRADDRQQAP